MQAEPEVLAETEVLAEPAEPDRYAVTTYMPPEPEVKFAHRVPRTAEERAAAAVLRALQDQLADTAMLSGLRTAAAERRVLVYSSNESEQSDVAQTRIGPQTALPTIGVVLNDGIAAKLGVPHQLSPCDSGRLPA